MATDAGDPNAVIGLFEGGCGAQAAPGDVAAAAVLVIDADDADRRAQTSLAAGECLDVNFDAAGSRRVELAQVTDSKPHRVPRHPRSLRRLTTEFEAPRS